MLPDQYGLPLSTSSSTARDAYLEGCAAKLTMYPGAIEAFDRAIDADPTSPSPTPPSARPAGTRRRCGRARVAIAAATALARNLPAREASHIAYFALLVAGDTEAALTALPAHLNAWPRDAMVLGTTAFTNGLIGSSGRRRPEAHVAHPAGHASPRTTATTGGSPRITAWRCRRTASTTPPARRSIAPSRRTPPTRGRRTPPRISPTSKAIPPRPAPSWRRGSPPIRATAPLYSHLSWHLALAHLEAGDAAAASRLFREAFAPEVHSGPPRGKLNDAVSFLWRWELAGHPRDTDAWRAMHAFANAAFPRAGSAFSDMHIALAQAVAGDDAALAARARQIEALARQGRYPSGPCVPAVSVASPPSNARDFPAAIDALEPIADELERIGGSHAQLDLVRFTLLNAYLAADRPDDAQRLLRERRRAGSRP